MAHERIKEACYYCFHTISLAPADFTVVTAQFDTKRLLALAMVWPWLGGRAPFIAVPPIHQCPSLLASDHCVQRFFLVESASLLVICRIVFVPRMPLPVGVGLG